MYSMHQDFIYRSNEAIVHLKKFKVRNVTKMFTFNLRSLNLQVDF